MRRKTDANQQAIVAALRQAGAQVLDLSRVGGGCPDLAVLFRGCWHFIEVKNSDGRGLRFTPAQEKWRQLFAGGSVVVMDAGEALEAIGAMWRGKGGK